MKGLASSRWRSRSDRRLAVESSSCGPERTARERPSAPKRREYARLASSQAYCKRDASSLSLPPRKRLVSPCASENAASPNPGADRMIKNHENLEWKVATVVENRSASISGKMRTLILSIKDDVRQFKGRRFGKIPSLERLENPRWIDAFTAPGQYMLVRCGGDDDFQQCGWTTEEARVCLSSTPYEAHNVRFVTLDRTQRERERGILLVLASIQLTSILTLETEIFLSSFAPFVFFFATKNDP